MNDNRKNLSMRISTDVSLKLKTDLRLFNILKKDEKDFMGLVKELQRDLLFLKLTSNYYGCPPVLYRRKIKNSGYAWKDNLENENVVRTMDSSYISGGLMEGKEKVVRMIQKMGPEDFEKCFLHDNPPSKDMVCKHYSLSSSDYEDIKNFVNGFIMAYENVPVMKLPSNYYKLIASISVTPPPERPPKAGNPWMAPEAPCSCGGVTGDRLRIEYTNIHYARGIYRINEDSLRLLKDSDRLNKDEKKHLKDLLDLIKIINWKGLGLNRVIESLVQHQREYFLKKEKFLKPMSQRQLAREIDLNPSTVSRIVFSKSLRTPWGEEVPLKNFFLSKKSYIIDKMKKILMKDKNISDNQIAEFLHHKYGVKISRRSVNLYRNIIKRE
jgi:hypothetical protein